MFGMIGTFGYFDPEPRQDFGEATAENRALISAVAKNGLQRWECALHFAQQQ
jgi:hypothetical protein